jgi:hypothetical protein
MHGNMEQTLTPAQLQEYRALMPDMMERLAVPHTGSSAEGSTVLLEHNPAVFPGQDPEARWVAGSPQSREATDVAANIAQKGFLPARDALETRAGTAEKIKTAGEHLADGGNLAIVTRHDNLTDIAYALKMGKDLLHGLGYDPRITTLIVGEMLSRIGHMFPLEPGGKPQKVPALMTLQVLCDIIYKSHPRTDSTDEAINELPKEQAEIMRAGMGLDNDEMLELLDEQLEQGGVLLGLAPTGTTRAEVAESGGLKLATLKSGTIDIMKRPDMRILCMLLEFGKAPFAYLLGDLMAIKNAEQAEAAMSMLARAETKDIRDTSDAELFRRFGVVALG